MQTNFYSKFSQIHSSVHTNANLSASTYKFSTITSSTVLVGSSPDDKITLLFSDHIMSIVYKTPVTVIYSYMYTHADRQTQTQDLIVVVIQFKYQLSCVKIKLSVSVVTASTRLVISVTLVIININY